MYLIMHSTNPHFTRDELIAAREIIDLHYSHPDTDTTESLSRVCFSLAQIFEPLTSEKTMWDEMFAYFDQEYWALKTGARRPQRGTIDKIYHQIVRNIEALSSKN